MRSCASRPFEPWVILLIAGLNLAGLVGGPLCMPVRADGGLLRFSAKKSGYQISVFTAPTPIRVGTVDISALVQDASTGTPMKDVRVTVRMRKTGTPDLESLATTEAATNKLFRGPARAARTWPVANAGSGSRSSRAGRDRR